MFRARVFPIPRNGEVKIEIVYHEMLGYDSGLVSYSYPLNTRNFHGPTVGDFSIDVSVESPVPIKNLYSPSHDIDRRVDGRTARCSYEEPNMGPGADFQLYYTVSEEDVGLNVTTYKRRGDDGYFAMLLSPGRLLRSDRVISKDVVFVIDRSGSMKGEKIEQARDALAYCVNSLNANDRFAIITFATDIMEFSDGLVANSDDQRRQALRFIDKIEARGGTDINEALKAALEMRRSKRPRFLIFLTDGAPTVGETDVNNIISNVTGENDGGAHLFAFGVGYDVNTTLLDRLTTDNKGTVEYVKPEEDIEVKVSSFYAKVSEPVLSDLTLRVDGVDVYDVYPRELPDLFNGGQLVVLGRYEDGGKANIRLHGYVEDNKKEFAYEARFKDRNRANGFIPRLWASRKIAYLMQEIRENGENKELIEEVIDLSMEHGIITPYTSYLVLEEDAIARRRMEGRGFVAGSYDQSAPAARSLASGFKKDTGESSFNVSKGLTEAKRQDVVSGDARSVVQHVAGKTFYRTENGWVDSEYREGDRTTDVEFLGDEYFALLDDAPEIAKYLSLGDNVIFVHDGTAYKVSSRA
jgi:Ca-activated chloride channel family protein